MDTNYTQSNKDFIRNLISNKLPLTNFPERVGEDFRLIEPSFFPFGGTYGFAEYESLLLRLVEFYDFNRFEFLNVHADKDVVFATLKAGVKNSENEILLCEQFIFRDDKISEIRVFVFN